MARKEIEPMKVLRKKCLAKGGNERRTFLSLHELTVETNGKEYPYYMVARGPEVTDPALKQPEAVVIVGVYEKAGEEKRLVVTSEFRPPIGRREVSFPAGMIDPQDMENGHHDIFAAAKKAAIREFREETGLIFEPKDVSPRHLFTSAGMTDECSIIVFGTASGDVDLSHLEELEDIEVLLLNRKEITKIVCDDKLAFSKVAWPLLWAYSKMGL
jgi:8-oxo-dGTP pyrophosphatase MutT (NUDIX family)